MKTVLITGASGDIGSACVRIFAQNGFNVVAQYNSNPVNIPDVFAVKADVKDEKSVKEMFSEARAKFGKIDVLINNAGIQQISMLCDTDADAWKRVIDVNLTGAYNTTKCALEDMMWSGGKIINVSSIWGQCGAACESAYSASKAGLIGFTKALAKEYSSINVNCICPGVIEGKMNKHLTDKERDELLEQIPLKRFGTPEDVAKVALFLASSDADYITGQVIAVNGGMYI
ncbi:MAG: 3-oxoacyl-ACP reductase FabG [Clostridia bacterium]|nr:3-oxoacyl-ACP reductase FabG [Clostridia bacterium]